jgi:hypothetical protein
MSSRSLSGTCPKCNHSVDYHRLKLYYDGIIRVRCVHRFFEPKPEGGKTFSRYCDCNCGFKTNVKVSTMFKEDSKK